VPEHVRRVGLSVVKPKRARLQVYLPPHAAAQLHVLAARGQVTISSVVRRALLAWLRADAGCDDAERPPSVDPRPDGPKVCRIGVRVSEPLFDCLAMVAVDYGQTPAGWCSALLSHVVDGRPLIRRDELRALEDASRQLRACGNLLNQVAHALNLDLKQGIEADAGRVDPSLIRRSLLLIESTSARVSDLLDSNRQAYRCADGLALDSQTQEREHV
jgi:Ribbon-helix-helix protein, copG family